MREILQLEFVILLRQSVNFLINICFKQNIQKKIKIKEAFGILCFQSNKA